MATIKGSLVQVRLRPAGVGSFKTLICTEDTTYELNSEVSTRRTNCGPQVSVADPEATITGNAVFDFEPNESTQVSWEELVGYQLAGTMLDYEYENDADTANGITEGEAVYRNGSGYITQTSFTASADADGLGSFSFTLTGTGEADEFDGES